MQSVNRVELTARLTQCGPLRHTPAGIPVFRFGLQHQSDVQEAGSIRRVALEISAVALGELAESLSGLAPESSVQVSGFLAPLHQRSTQLVLHVQAVAPAQ
ncbi:MAG TPA: primosomal replication protein N [Castellaniella sp.]|uniref:primosomal replication protein N n=1 Tax=Castellaniella sp. TaxID=1955812 RepID=UPI002EE179B8